MSKKDYEFDYELEQKAEEILRLFAMEMADNNEKLAKAILNDEPVESLFEEETAEMSSAAEIEAEPESEPKTESDFREVQPRRGRNLLRRSIVLIAVLIFIMAVAAVTSEGVRLKLSSLFFGDAPASTLIVDDSNLVVDLEKVELGYVPEGFEVVNDEMFLDYSRMINCLNSDDVPIVCTITKTEQYVNNVDNERSENEEIKINDKQGYLFANGDRLSVVWQIGDCTCQVTAPIGKDELKHIAEQVVIL